MVSSSVLALLSATALASGFDGALDDQIFTTSVAVATSTVHVDAPSATGAPAVPENWIKFGTEIAAILVSNFRVGGIEHKDGVDLARSGLQLLTAEPAVLNLIATTVQYIKDNHDAIAAGQWKVSPSFALQAVHAFHATSEAVMASPGFPAIDSWIKENGKKFDLAAYISDMQNLCAIDPDMAQKGQNNVQKAFDQNPANKEALASAIDMVQAFGNAYQVDETAITPGIRDIFNAFLA